ncbi:MAG: hypothetical protein ACK4GN_11280 [Runella sp.]
MKPLLLLISFVVYCTQTAAQTLHLLLVSDIENTQTGMATLSDEAKVLQLFQTVAKGIGFQIKTTYLNRADFTRAAVQKTINKLPTTSNDIICFYYLGLGYYLPNNPSLYPLLRLKNHQSASLSLDEVGDLLNAKTARLRLALADCREAAVMLKDTQSAFPPPPAQLSIKSDLTRPLLKALFLDHCGLIKAASAARTQTSKMIQYEVAYVNYNVFPVVVVRKDTETYGSVFTGAFSESFDEWLLNSTVRDIQEANFRQFFGGVQNYMNYRLRTKSTPQNKQDLQWTEAHCQSPAAASSRVAFQAMSVRPPVPVYPVGSREIQTCFQYLTTLREVSQRQAYLSRLQDIFLPGATVILTKNNGLSPTDPLFKKQESRIPAEQYLATLQKPNAFLKEIKIGNVQNMDVSVLEMNVTEIWQKL